MGHHPRLERQDQRFRRDRHRRRFNRSGDGVHGSANQYWIAINQSLDAAAADVYAGVSFDSGSVTHTVSAAEAATSYTAAETESQTDDGAAGFRAKASPCYTVDGQTITKATAGTQCEVEREGVFNFIVGVRLKF